MAKSKIKEKTDKLITIGIPAFKALDHIEDLLCSIQTQTIVDKIEVIIANDNPSDNGKYDFLKPKYKYPIKTLTCEINGGPGIARQRCLDAAITDWITFIDADDVLFSPFSIETLVRGIQQNVVEVQGPFLQEVREPNPMGARVMPRNDVTHP